MGFYFRRSVKLFPGLRLNLSAHGVGISADVKGFHSGITAHGRMYTSASLPGSGIGFRRYSPRRIYSPHAITPPSRSHAIGFWAGWWFLPFAILIAIVAYFRISR
jgi:hypothetical protein